MEDFKSTSDPKEECELKWSRWKGFLHGIIFYLKKGRHLDELNELEKKVMEEWTEFFYIDARILKLKSRTSGIEITPITSYLECFKRISECHICPEASGRVVHLGFEETLRAALAGCVWPRAEDEVNEYLKLCFQCNSTINDGQLIDRSHEDDLPHCFSSRNASLLFSKTSDKMAPMNSHDLGGDDPLNQSYERPTTSPKRAVKNKSDAAKKTLAKAKRTLIKVNVEQYGKVKRRSKDSSSKTDGKHKSSISGEEHTMKTTTEEEAELTNGDKPMNEVDGKTHRKYTKKANKRALPDYFKKESNISPKRLSIGSNKEQLMGKDAEVDGRLDESKDPKKSSSTICNGCGLEVACKSQLYDHWKVGSPPKKRYKCCLCPFVDASFPKFASHMELDHKLARPTREYRKSTLNPPALEQVNSKNQEMTHSDLNVSSSDLNFEMSLENGESARKNKTVVESSLRPPEQTRNDAKMDAETTQEMVKTLQASSQIYNHVCEICCTLLSSSTSLEYHLSFLHKINFSKFPFKVLSRSDPRDVSPKPFFSCEECGDRFWSAEGLNLHTIDVHTDPMEDNIVSVTCDICKNNKEQDMMSHMSKHRITVCDMYLFKFCVICSKHMSCSRSFEKHMLTVHSDHFKDRPSLYSAILSRVVDGNMSANLGSSIEALKSHTPSATFISHLQNSTKASGETTRFNMSGRKRMCPDLGTEEFKCPQCGCEFSAGESFEAHFEQYHHVKCHTCSKDFTTSSAYRRHVQFFHRDVDHQNLRLPQPTFPGVNSHDDGNVDKDFTVAPSDWKPSSARPKGKISLYFENSLGDWNSGQSNTMMETLSC